MMTLNPQITKTLKKYHIDVSEALCYLFCLRNELEIDHISVQTVKQVNETCDFFEKDYENAENIKWKIPFYVEDTLQKIEFVEDFREKFKRVNPTRNGVYNEVKKRLIRFMKENEDYNKDIILGAVDKYLDTMMRHKTDPTYIKSAHRFIFDGKGKEKSSMLKKYCEIYIEKSDQEIVDIDE